MSDSIMKEDTLGPSRLGYAMGMASEERNSMILDSHLWIDISFAFRIAPIHIMHSEMVQPQG